MDFQSNVKVKLSLLFLLWLIGAIISYLFPILFDPFYDWIQDKLEYKGLLLILILTILVILYSFHLFLSNNVQSKKATQKTNREIESIMKNLTPKEKSLLREYLVDESKVLYISKETPEAKSLQYSGILDGQEGKSWTQYKYFLKDWAWEYINKNKSDFLKDS